jgi:hypothetical protein
VSQREREGEKREGEEREREKRERVMKWRELSMKNDCFLSLHISFISNYF